MTAQPVTPQTPADDFDAAAPLDRLLIGDPRAKTPQNAIAALVRFMRDGGDLLSEIRDGVYPVRHMAHESQSTEARVALGQLRCDVESAQSALRKAIVAVGEISEWLVARRVRGGSQ